MIIQEERKCSLDVQISEQNISRANLNHGRNTVAKLIQHKITQFKTHDVKYLNVDPYYRSLL